MLDTWVCICDRPAPRCDRRVSACRRRARFPICTLGAIDVVVAFGYSAHVNDRGPAFVSRPDFFWKYLAVPAGPPVRKDAAIGVNQ